MSARHDTAIRWIHLSDLHLGCQGEAVWWDVRDDFADSVTQMVERVGPPDLVLMTGDLAYSGAALRADEYDLVDRFLAMLRETLEQAGVARQQRSLTRLRRHSAGCGPPQRSCGDGPPGADPVPEAMLDGGDFTGAWSVSTLFEERLTLVGATWTDARVEAMGDEQMFLLECTLNRTAADVLAAANVTPDGCTIID